MLKLLALFLMVFWILCHKVRAVVKELNNKFVAQKYSLVPVLCSSVCIQYYTLKQNANQGTANGGGLGMRLAKIYLSFVYPCVSSAHKHKNSSN